MNCNAKMTFWMTATFLFLSAASADGQFVSEMLRPAEVPPNNTFRLQPVKPPRVSMDLQLLPPFLDSRDENAAVHYGKAANAQNGRIAILATECADLAIAPMDTIKDVETFSTFPEDVYRHLRNAALCRYCHWQTSSDFDEIVNSNTYPELKPARDYGRILAAKGRYHIARGEFAEALDVLQTGYGLVKHVSAGPTFIHILVAIAIQTQLDLQVEKWVQQPNAPSLYWALATLSDSLISIEKASRAERLLIETLFPEFRDISYDRVQQRKDEYWIEMLAKLYTISGGFGGSESPMAIDEEKASEQVAMIVEKRLRAAQLFLIKESLTKDQIKGLSPTQTVVLAAIREYQRDQDNLFRWTFFPYHQAVENLEKATKKRAEDSRQTVLGISKGISPAIQQIMAAHARSKRQLAILQLAEAVRIYAFENQGRLPKSLPELHAVPVPEDPVTGEPFQFELKDERIEITGPRLPSGPLRVAIKIAEPK